eukprot:TRINITY_DN63557_c0_g1_i2.p1 TRINITY_DN63557_c0_g1~~TRINITY_DN63557_c0_g1_i2.p1  ORF type:complete len:201 (+),score=14.28 TRINITY_DN63557_c0_g1_i2:92-694(+)
MSRLRRQPRVLIQTLRNPELIRQKGTANGSSFVIPDSLEKSGLTLGEIQHALQFMLSGATAEKVAHKATITRVDDVAAREVAKEQGDETTDHLLQLLTSQILLFGGCLVNYHMTTIGQTGGCGHFSLAVGISYVCINGCNGDAAVNSSSSEPYVLLLDPWPETPVCWVPWALLKSAMDTVDGGSGEKRGMVIVAEHVVSS